MKQPAKGGNDNMDPPATRKRPHGAGTFAKKRRRSDEHQWMRDNPALAAANLVTATIAPNARAHAESVNSDETRHSLISASRRRQHGGKPTVRSAQRTVEAILAPTTRYLDAYVLKRKKPRRKSDAHDRSSSALSLQTRSLEPIAAGHVGERSPAPTDRTEKTMHAKDVGRTQLMRPPTKTWIHSTSSLMQGDPLTGSIKYNSSRIETERQEAASNGTGSASSNSCTSSVAKASDQPDEANVSRPSNQSPDKSPVRPSISNGLIQVKPIRGTRRLSLLDDFNARVSAATTKRRLDDISAVAYSDTTTSSESSNDDSPHDVFKHGGSVPTDALMAVQTSSHASEEPRGHDKVDTASAMQGSPQTAASQRQFEQESASLDGSAEEMRPPTKARTRLEDATPYDEPERYVEDSDGEASKSTNVPSPLNRSVQGLGDRSLKGNVPDFSQRTSMGHEMAARATDSPDAQSQEGTAASILTTTANITDLRLKKMASEKHGGEPYGPGDHDKGKARRSAPRRNDVQQGPDWESDYVYRDIEDVTHTVLGPPADDASIEKCKPTPKSFSSLATEDLTQTDGHRSRSSSNLQNGVDSRGNFQTREFEGEHSSDESNHGRDPSRNCPRQRSPSSDSSHLSELSRTPSPPGSLQKEVYCSPHVVIAAPTLTSASAKKARRTTGNSSGHFTPPKRPNRTSRNTGPADLSDGDLVAQVMAQPKAGDRGEQPKNISTYIGSQTADTGVKNEIPVTPKTRAMSKTARSTGKSTGKISTHFIESRVDLYNTTASSRRVPAGTSTTPAPSINEAKFGIIQEDYWDQPFWLLVAVTLLNKTTGRAAIPVFRKIMQHYPSPEDLAQAEHGDLLGLIQSLGLQNNRTKTLLKFAEIWVQTPPVRGRLYRKKDYPNKGDGKAVDVAKIVEEDVDLCEGAIEIGHLYGCGAYAYDSWRIFCRDVLRGVAEDYKGRNAAVEDFEPEWKRVVPGDKELRACLRWMWLKEGWIWDPLTGQKRRATEEEMQRAVQGEMAIDDPQEQRFATLAAGVQISPPEHKMDADEDAETDNDDPTPSKRPGSQARRQKTADANQGDVHSEHSQASDDNIVVKPRTARTASSKPANARRRTPSRSAKVVRSIEAGDEHSQSRSRGSGTRASPSKSKSKSHTKSRSRSESRDDERGEVPMEKSRLSADDETHERSAGSTAPRRSNRLSELHNPLWR